MRRWWKIAAVTDGILLAVAFGCMVWFNNRPDHGLAALTGVGQFALWFLVFQVALAFAIALAIWALIVYIRKKR
ncbi:MAG: hypothetical protein E7553_01350 [Ruminococcaceae bacterium]|nr:hypothetical protein [Oscillospiraceae bacterium]